MSLRRCRYCQQVFQLAPYHLSAATRKSSSLGNLMSSGPIRGEAVKTLHETLCGLNFLSAASG